MTSICIVTQSFYDFDVRVRRKSEALVAAGYTADVLCLRSTNRPSRYTLNGVNVYTVPLGKKRASLPRYFLEYVVFFLWVFVRVPLLMRRRRYGVIDVNTLPDFLIFAPVIARCMGAKLVLDMHEITPEFYMSKYGIKESSWLVRLLKWLERISFNFADHVTTINEPIQDLFVGRGLCRPRSTVIMNVADEARFIAAAGPSAAADAAAGPAKFVMMYHGTLTRIYGLQIAVEAFDMAQREMPEAEFWILGLGPEESVLADMIQRRGLASKVRMFGPIAASEIPAWLSKCNIGILPMRRDVFLDLAFPNKLAEYIIMGKPVLISRLKALRHYFSEEALAYFEPNDPVDLARQMVRVYRDAGRRACLAAKAAEEYAPIRWGVMKERYLHLIESLVGSARQPAEQSHAAETTALAR